MLVYEIPCGLLMQQLISLHSLDPFLCTLFFKPRPQTLLSVIDIPERLKLFCSLLTYESLALLCDDMMLLLAGLLTV